METTLAHLFPELTANIAGPLFIDGFDGQMTWDGSESKELAGADESVKLEELKSSTTSTARVWRFP